MKLEGILAVAAFALPVLIYRNMDPWPGYALALVTMVLLVAAAVALGETKKRKSD